MAGIMVVGTASSAGKSLMATALCRIFNKDGYRENLDMTYLYSLVGDKNA